MVVIVAAVRSRRPARARQRECRGAVAPGRVVGGSCGPSQGRQAAHSDGKSTCRLAPRIVPRIERAGRRHLMSNSHNRSLYLSWTPLCACEARRTARYDGRSDERGCCCAMLQRADRDPQKKGYARTAPMLNALTEARRRPHDATAHDSYRVRQRVRHAGFRPGRQRLCRSPGRPRRGFAALGQRGGPRVGRQRHQARQPERRIANASSVEFTPVPLARSRRNSSSASKTKAKASTPRASPTRLRPRTSSSPAAAAFS